jgi:SulP family sulfate permease
VLNSPLLLRLFPFLHRWPAFSNTTLKADLVAGLTGGIILVPQGVAFATIAGMPPEFGLYAAMIPAIVAALWGSSWHLVSGPTTAISIVVFSTISPLAAAGSPEYIKLVLTLTLLVGIFQLMLGLLRLGTLVNFVSHTVVVGFTAGAAVLIAGSQVSNFFGISIPRGSSMWRVAETFLSKADQINWMVTAVALVTVIAGVIVRRHCPRIPFLIAAMLAGSLLAFGFNQVYGEAITGITSIGALTVGLPPLSMPDFSLATIEKLTPIAIAVALLALTEAVSISRAIALKSGQRIDGNQEFIGQGLSNLSGAFFSGYASSGSFNRSGLNFAAGAKTPLAAISSAVFLLVIVIFLAPLAKYLPTAAMAGILFLVAWGLVDVKEIKQVLKVSRPESAVLIATFISTLTLDLEFAIYIGVLLSLVLYLNRTSRPPLEDVRPDPSGNSTVFIPGTAVPVGRQLGIVRLNGSIFFGSVNHLQESFDQLRSQNPQQENLLLVASGINFIDLAGAHLLAEEAKRRRAQGGALFICLLKDEPAAMLEKSGAADHIGRENIMPVGTDVMKGVYARIDASRGQLHDPHIASL